MTSNTTEHTDQSVVTEHAQPLQRISFYDFPFAFRPLPAALAEGASAGGVAEHNAPAAPLAPEPILLDLNELRAIRAAARHDKTSHALHDQARETLNTFATAPYDGPTCLNDLFPWKAYLAFHAKGEIIVGPGISRAVVDQLKDVKDPNRGGRPRTDFIFYRVDGSAYRIHPGTKRKNDAAPVYCPPSLATEQIATCVWHTRPMDLFTYEHACRIPQTDKLGKEQAFRTIQTDPEQFQRWLFAANLGLHTERVIGSGLTSSSLLERSDTSAKLRFQRHDESTIDIEIVYIEKRGYKIFVGTHA